MWLVSGGAGFCGRAVVRALLVRGERVRVFDCAPDAELGCEHFQGDVRDAAAVARACAGVARVIHLAAAVPLARDQALFDSVNVTGTRNVVQAAKRAGARAATVVSSSAVYGAPERLPVTEQTPPDPLEPYGRSKLQADELALALASRDFAVSIVRPRTVLGAGRMGLFSLLFSWVRRGRPLPLLGDGAAVYQFVHADDLAQACVAAALQAHCGPFLAGSVQPWPIGALLRGLCDHAGTGSRVWHLPAGPVRMALQVASKLPGGAVAPYHAHLYGKPLWFDVSRTCLALDWQPQRDDLASLCESYDWFAAHGAQHAGATAHTRPMAPTWLDRW